MSRKFLTTEDAFDNLMSLADESDDSDTEMIILPPDPDIVTDDEEIDDACTSIEHSDAIFDEKLQEETAGKITDMISGKSPLELFEVMAENMIAQAVEESNKFAGIASFHIAQGKNYAVL
ncbi:hypothetical protein AVEN_162771-1 [Araneus ventricosus]|uniref:PiggyBac transposable element-derived protein domain-containing protein n=1 Tax=Araneus ventricosus TaxID=182803 RepID=A0A4Y2CVL9_ARAVE|nr:hypothetical protein AVEN_162771-1 [Araneus ventricosus]